jgi:hypothetical protein
MSASLKIALRPVTFIDNGESRAWNALLTQPVNYSPDQLAKRNR